MLTVQITKRADGGSLLRCVRADGSYTWQKQSRAVFFALHDLTHFAVETALGLTQGFFGLIAQGWDIDDTTGKGSRGRVPAEAGVAEHLVGWLDMERASGCAMTARDFNDQMVAFAASLGRSAPAPITDEELASIRDRRGELFAQWRTLAPGSTLELHWEL